MRVFIISLLLTSFAQADSDEISFDAIVDDLSRSRTSTSRSKLGSGDPFDEIQIHLGLGVATGVFAIEHSDRSNTQANQRGFAVNLGIDLFNPNLMAEGSITSYMERDYDRTNIGLQEFNLKLLYKDFIESQIGYRLGGGLAARYLSVTRPNEEEKKYSTPAWIAVAGLDIYITKGLSLGGEVASKGSLTHETPDQGSLDFALRLDAHF